MARASLKDVSTSTVERLRAAIASGELKTPVDHAGLVGCGIRHQIETLGAVLAGHKSAACTAILDVVLAEREERKPTPELVWTGPEGPGGTARDTAVVLRELFESARESVILAGYSFDHAQNVLAPLHASMMAYGVRTCSSWISSKLRRIRRTGTSPVGSAASSRRTGRSGIPSHGSVATSAR